MRTLGRGLWVWLSMMLVGCAATNEEAAAPSRVVACPRDAEWDGQSCVRANVTAVTCPLGTRWDGARCIGKLDTTCPAGFHYERDKGCKVDVVVEEPGPTPRLATCLCEGDDRACFGRCHECVSKRRFHPELECPDVVGAAPRVKRAFDRDAAVETLELAGHHAAVHCLPRGIPRAFGHVTVTFAPTGEVTSAVVDAGSLMRTTKGLCVERVFREAKVLPFSGGSVTLGRGIYL